MQTVSAGLRDLCRLLEFPIFMCTAATNPIKNKRAVGCTNQV